VTLSSQEACEVFPGQGTQWAETSAEILPQFPEKIVFYGPRGEVIPEPWEFKAKPRAILGPMDKFPALGWMLPGLIFLSLAFGVSVFSWNDRSIETATSGFDLFHNGQLFQLLTALFAHGSIEHFLSNALPLLVFSWLLAGYFGFWLFPVVPLVIGVLSNLVTVSVYAPNVRLLGASGMIYGMVALWLVLFLKFSKNVNWVVKVMRSAGFVLLLLFPTQYEPHVSYLAHASGFAVGVGAGFVVLPFVKTNSV
jgi:rhomboid protease GluP